MRNKINYLVVSGLLASTMCISCSTDLKFDLPKTDPLLAIQSFVDPDKEFELMATIAKPIQEQNIRMDRNCQVNIYENDLFFSQLSLDPSSFIQGQDTQRLLKFHTDPGLHFSEGKKYKVEMNHPGFEPVIAQTIKPISVKIKNVTYRHIKGEMPDWYYKTPSKMFSDDHSGIIKRDTSLVEFTITFDDPNITRNFYRLGVKLLIKGNLRAPYFDRKIQYASLTEPEPPFMKVFYDPDYSVGSSNPIIYEILYNDINSNGKEQSFKILAPSWSGRYVIYLYTLSEDYYKYVLDRWKFLKTTDDPFAEPIRYYSNLNTGCGIFAFSSMDTDTIQF